jgi:hypothetical protein
MDEAEETGGRYRDEKIDHKSFRPWDGHYIERKAEALVPGDIIVERAEEQIDIFKVEKVSLVLQEIPGGPTPGAPPVPRVVAHLGPGWVGSSAQSYREYAFGKYVEVLSR